MFTNGNVMQIKADTILSKTFDQITQVTHVNCSYARIIFPNQYS